MARLSEDQIYAIVREYFGDLGNETVNLMANIIMAESGGDYAAVGDNVASGHQAAGSAAHTDYGLFQINSQHGYDADRLVSDPAYNAAAAREIFDRQGAQAWSTYPQVAKSMGYVEGPRMAESAQPPKNGFIFGGPTTGSDPIGGPGPTGSTSGFKPVGPPTASGYQQYFDARTGANYWTDPSGRRVSDPLAAAAEQGRTLFPDELAQIKAQTEQIKLATDIARAQFEGKLIPLPGTPGKFLIPGTSTIVDTRTPGQFGQIEGLPGYMFDPVSGQVIDNNGNQIARDQLDHTKARFAMEFPEEVRQFNATLDANAEQASLDRAERGLDRNENRRQFDITNAQGAARDDRQFGLQEKQFGLEQQKFGFQQDIANRQQGLEEQKNAQEILRNPSDYLARAFFQRGGTSPLPKVTQADLLNQMKMFQGQQPRPSGEPAGVEGFDPNNPYAWHAAQGNIPGGLAGMQARLKDQFTGQVGAAAQGLPNKNQFNNQDSANVAAAGLTNLPTMATGFGTGGNAVTGAQQGGAFQLSQTPGFGAPAPTLTQGPGLMGTGPYSGDPLHAEAYQEPNRFAATGGVFPGGTEVITGDGKNGKPSKKRTGSEESVKLVGSPEALRKVFMVVDPITKDEPMPEKPKAASGGFFMGQGQMPQGPVNQQQLVDMAQQFSGPAVNSVMGGGTPPPLRFGFNLMTPQQMAGLTGAEKQMLNTRLAVEHNTDLDDVGTAIEQQFGAKRRTPKARLGGY